MSVAYIDTSALISIVFNERNASALIRRLSATSRLLSSNLLEAELRAACAREETNFPAGFVSGIEWVLPNRPLTPELAAVLEAGYLKGADLWHVATACYLAGEIDQEPAALSFVTLDARQRKVAATLGFQT